MSEGNEATTASLASGEWQRLHPVSALFVAAQLLRHVALPLLAALVLGRGAGWEAIAAFPLGLAAIWAVLEASRYRYALQGEELVIHEGVLGRRVRHVPLARIHNTSRLRKLPHRLLGVTELHLESAAGGKPEAVMRVLHLEAALVLESALRTSGAGAKSPSIAHGEADSPAAGTGAVGPQELHRLSALEILKLGLISNRGMVVVGMFFAAIGPKQELNRRFFGWFREPVRAMKATFADQLAGGHRLWLLLEVALLVLMFMALVRGLSVILAYFRYQGFRLEQEGEKLVVHRGLSTQVTASARLPRLQRWELVETWLHRRFDRCRLEVSVAGNDPNDHEHGLDPSGRFDELAPIGTPAQAQALLRRCLPGLDWSRLQWQPLGEKAFWRRLWGSGRFLLIVLLGVLALDAMQGWSTTPTEILGVAAVGAVLLILYCRAWVRFAAFAECGELLLYRHGVLTRRWVVVAGPRLQQLSLYSSALDRSLGLCHLRADSQGSAKTHRALDIPCLPLEVAERLRARLWGQVLRPY